MTHDEALAQIGAGNAHERLQAARQLLSSAVSEDWPTIEQAARKETVLWIKTAIADIQKRLTPGPHEEIASTDSAQTERELLNDEYVQDLQVHAVREATELILHEIQPIAAMIGLANRNEITNYENSDSKRHFDTLNQLMTVIAELRATTTRPRFQEFDLEELIGRVCREESQATKIKVQLAGSRLSVIVSDPGRLSLALRNGIRNAIEATTRADASPPYEPVVVAWGSRPSEYWIAIMDGGKGLRSNTLRMFDIGSTTKAHHFGMGLPLTRRAIESLGGDVTLSKREPYGAKLEFRWPRFNAEEAGAGY